MAYRIQVRNKQWKKLSGEVAEMKAECKAMNLRLEEQIEWKNGVVDCVNDH